MEKNRIVDNDNNWAMTLYLEIRYKMGFRRNREEANKIYLEKIIRIIKEKPNLSSENIKKVLEDIFYFSFVKDFQLSDSKDGSKKVKSKSDLEQERLMINCYAKKILDIYEKQLSPTDLVCLCMNIRDKDFIEGIIRKYYKKIKKEIRKTLYVSSADINNLPSVCENQKYTIEKLFKEKNYQIKIGSIDPNNFYIMYKYFGDNIKFLDYPKIKKYRPNDLLKLNIDTLFSLFQLELKNENTIEIENILNFLQQREYENRHLSNILTLREWKNIFKNKMLIKKILIPNVSNQNNFYPKNFGDKFLEVIKEQIKNLRVQSQKITSIYNIDYICAIELLSHSSYKDHQKDYLFLLCFKMFFKEFVNYYQEKITTEDIVYLERLFQRAIQGGNVYHLLLINNQKSLFHFYKTNEYIKQISIPIEYIRNYKVKQYKKIQEIIFFKLDNYSLKTSYTTSKDKNFNEHIIVSLNILDYDLTLKLINYKLSFWIELIDILKNKTPIYIDKIKQLIKTIDSKEEILMDYSASSYQMAFEQLIESSTKKITIKNLNKIMRSIKALLVPYNIHIEQNLEKLNFVSKGEPFLEKINGIKLFDKYRKRLFSSIPNFYEKYQSLEYGLVDLHDPNIISNGIGNYLLPGNQKNSSCLTPNGKAKSCLEHGALNPNGRFFAIKHNQKIMAYSWLWRSGNILCFDNIEITDEVEKIEDYEDKIYKIYLITAEQLMIKTRQEAKGGIKLVLIGRNKIDIKNKKIDSLPLLNNVSRHLYKPNTTEPLYLKDSSEKQVILCGEYKDNLDTEDVEPLYPSKRGIVKDFNHIDRKKLEQRMNSIYYDYCLQKNIKYKKIENNYLSGYIGEDWFIGEKSDKTYDFFYYDNDKRLFDEVKQYIQLKEKEEIFPSKIYIPKFKIENILKRENLQLDNEVYDYLKNLNTNDYIIPETYFSHTASSLKILSQIFQDGQITSASYGNHPGGSGTNGKHYICIAKVNSPIYELYKKTGTIILDGNMQTIASAKAILPTNLENEFKDTKYPIRITTRDGEHQVLDKISLEHAKFFLAFPKDSIQLAQLTLLNDIYNLNLPIILEPTKSKIDTGYIKKHIKIKK